MNIKNTAVIAASVWCLACSGEDGGEEACDSAAAGVICTIAGSGQNGYSGDGGPALAAEFSLPQDTLTAPDGDTYILDWNNHRIRKLTPDGTVEHVAGRGELGGTLDDPANSDFNHPTGMIFDSTGRRIIVAAWHNSKIRTLDLETGDIEDTCGDGRRAYAGDDGPARTATLDLPTSLALDSDGTLVIMDQANQVLRAIDSQGVIRTLAGQCVIDRAEPEGPGHCPAGQVPTKCPGPTPFENKFTCGAPMTCSQPCNPAFGGDEEPMGTMRMAQPFGQSADPGGRLAFDSEGTLFFADTSNGLIRAISRDGIVRRVAGTLPLNGRPQVGYSGDGGPALEAKLYNPVDLAFGDDGTLYFSDVYNHCIRQISPDGTISAVAGQCGEAGYAGDGGRASEALLKRPYGIEWVDGKLLISDTGNSVIRVVTLP